MRPSIILSLVTLTLVACATGTPKSEQFKADVAAGRCNEARAKADQLDTRGRIATMYAYVSELCDRDKDAAKRYLHLGARYGEPVARDGLAKMNLPVPPSDLAHQNAIQRSSPDLLGAFLEGFLGAKARQDAEAPAPPSPFVMPTVQPPTEARKSKAATETAPPYRGTSGLGYQYDLSKPSDQLRYETDVNAQTRDYLDSSPRREIDQSMGQRGGGVLK